MTNFPGSFTLNNQRFSVWSGNPAFAVDSADGATFWACNAKRVSDKQMFIEQLQHVLRTAGLLR